MTPLGKDGKDAHGRRGQVFQHADQPPCPQILAHFPQGAPGQALPGQRPVMQHRAVVAGQAPAHLEHQSPGRIGRVPEHPAPLLTEGKAIVPGQVFQAFRPAAAGQIGGAGHHQAPHFPEAHAHQAGVGHLADAHGAVDALIDQVHQPVGEIDVGGDFRVFLE